MTALCIQFVDLVPAGPSQRGHVDLAADDWLYTLFFAGAVEIHRAVHNAVVGDGCIINMYSSVTHDTVLGEYCTISAHCDITGQCELGDRVFMGSTSQVVPGLKIGDDVYICAGSTVMTRVRSGRKVLGNPAKIVNF